MFSLLIYFRTNLSFLENKDINLGSKYIFDFDFENLNLKVNKNINYLQNYWPANIISFKTIVGENGVGKTTILNQIKKYRQDPLLILEFEEIILIYESEIYELYISGNLIRKDILINGTYYEINDTDTLISVEGLDKPLKIVTVQNNTTSKQNEKKFDLIYYTNHWSYSAEIREDSSKIENEGYYDLSLAHRVNTMVRHFSQQHKRHSPITYIDRLKQEEIYSALNYIKVQENRVNLEEYLFLPEYLDIILSPVMESKSGYRFSNKNLLGFNVENYLYKRIASINKEVMDLRSYLLLVILNDFFSAIENITDRVGYIESRKEDYYERGFFVDRINLEEILNILSEFINNILDSEYNLNKNQIKIKWNKYKAILHYLFDEFIYGVKAFNSEEKILINGEYKLYEQPKIELDQKGIEIAIDVYLESKKLFKGLNNIFCLKWKNFSSGETQLLNLITLINMKIEESYNENILILLDEVEIGLHPHWQKKLVKLLVENFQRKAELKGINVQIILATHSPFILSDMPFNAALLLEKNGDKTKVRENLDDQAATLGANIHELYSNSFFLKGGLIGDYAKEKINSIANRLIRFNPLKEEIKESEWEEIYSLIIQIGEPLIKNRLLELYNQKIGKDAEIRSIKKKMLEMERRLNYLTEENQ